MESPLLVFISSVIAGMTAERQAAQAAIQTIPLSRPWVFEHSAASSQPLAESYLSHVRGCDIFVLLLGASVTDPVKAEVQTAQAAGKPLLVFLSAQAPASVVDYARSLGVKYATYTDADGLAVAVVEAVSDELITGYRRHSVPPADWGRIGEFVERVKTGGGAVVFGDVHTSGGDFIGRDKVVQGDEVRGDNVLHDKINSQINAGSGSVVITAQGSTIIVGDAPVTMTAVDRQSALGRYLQHVISRNRYLQLQGIHSRGRLVQIELDQVYIKLRATRQRLLETEEHWLAAEAGLAPGELQRPSLGARTGNGDAARAFASETVTVEVNTALAEHARLVVLGDPGSGKTTLLRYLALVYARTLAEGSGLVHEQLSLDENGWLPILLPLRQIGAFLRARPDDGTEGHAQLLAFLRQALANERIVLPDDFFDDRLQGGRGVILLDGLDEVADPDLRRRVARLVESFTAAYPQCRYVVTSRVVGYTGPARLGEGYVPTTIQDFTLTDVGQFLTNWHRLVAIGLMAPGESAEAYAAEQTRQLLAAIRGSERIRELAINPLMLTVIAMVHRDRVKLPDRRAELYAEAVDVLLGKWDEARGVKETAILLDRPFDTGDKRLMLQGLALAMHEAQKKEWGVEELRRWLAERFADIVPDVRAVEGVVERFLNVIQERTGLLVARGEGVYAFSHLTFQEYLAALAVAARDDYVAYTLGRVPDPWWREVILLEAGYLSTQSQERTSRLIRAIVGLREETELYHNLVLAAECVRDVGEGRVPGNLAAQVRQQLRRELETPPPKGALGSLQALFTRGMTARSLAARRLAAVRAMAAIGGIPFWSQPYGEPEWVTVPAGEFWMGSDSGSGGEKPVHRVYVGDFQIARVPITNAQYQLFVEQTGHQALGHWQEGGPPKGQESHPVVMVSWHDALAYCGWLSQVTGKRIALPTEAQWEKAARGAKDRREYPWGDTFEAARCNSVELGLHSTAPVGVFSEGASPCGVLDMAGNVWEWTASLYQPYPYQVDDGRNAPEAEGYRVLRGGSWNYNWWGARCAVRFRGNPGGRGSYVGLRLVVSLSDSGF